MHRGGAIASRHEFRAHLNTAAVRAAYSRLRPNEANNLVRKALRAALIPVREAMRMAWSAERFAEGRSSGKGRRKRIRRVRFSSAWKLRRTGNARKVVVRKAIARAITIRADRHSSGRFVAGVGVDYSKKGLKGQHRIAHILERGRGASRKAGPVRGRNVNEKVIARMREGVERSFVEHVQRGLASGISRG